MNALQKALTLGRAKMALAHDRVLQLQVKGDFGGSGLLSSMVTPNVPSMASDWQQQSRNRESYAFFRSWCYAAIHALGMAAAKQPVNVGKLKPQSNEEEKSIRIKSFQAELKRKMVPNLRNKAAKDNVEVLIDHSVVKMLEKPNPLQDRFQFVYSFIANLNLTGRAYIIRDQDKESGEIQYYSLPSTWVRPDHQNGPFSRFYVTNPRNLDYVGGGKPLDRSQVSFAYMPNPADPMGCMSPASSQSAAVRVDDRIQTCKEKFFDNGIFPSVIVTIGKDPHPDVPGGMRPRLTAAQRRQVNSAIRRSMGSVANYGNVGIIDGLIESIVPFSRVQSELGWEKSEPEIKTRILSAFGVHPFILGEPVGVGGYAQTYNIMSVFYERINTFLDILSVLMTGFVNSEMEEAEEEETSNRSDRDKVQYAGGSTEEGKAKKPAKKPDKKKTKPAENLLIWWEMAEARDPQLDWSNLNAARARGDVTKNELRARLGLSADDEVEDPKIDPKMLTGIQGVLVSLGMGSIQPSQAYALFLGIGVPEKFAEAIAYAQAPQEGEQEGTEEGGMEQAKKALKRAIKALRQPVEVYSVPEAERIIKQLECEVV